MGLENQGTIQIHVNLNWFFLGQGVLNDLQYFLALWIFCGHLLEGRPLFKGHFNTFIFLHGHRMHYIFKRLRHTRRFGPSAESEQGQYHHDIFHFAPDSLAFRRASSSRFLLFSAISASMRLSSALRYLKRASRTFAF